MTVITRNTQVFSGEPATVRKRQDLTVMTMKTGKHYLGIILTLTISLFITSATGDIYFDKVGLLLPFDGSDGDTSSTDISNSNHSLAFGGNAKISAVQSKYGGSSCYFDGKDDYLTVSDSEDWNFGTGDFTVEFWIWRSGLKNSEKSILPVMPVFCFEGVASLY